MILSGIKHIQLRVKDIRHMTQFYQHVLGMVVLEEKQGIAILGTKEKALLTLIEHPSFTEPKEPVLGLYHVAYLLPERTYLAAFLKHIIDTKTLIEGASDHGVSEAIYMRDPEQNGIEIYVDRPKTMWPMSQGTLNMFTQVMDIEDLMTLSIPFEGLPTGTMIGHVHQHVDNISTHESFYRYGLGMDLVLSYGSSASFLSYDGYHHHIGINTWKGRSIPKPLKTDYGLDLVTLAYESEETLSSVIKALEKHSYFVAKQDDGWLTEDPSGHRYLLVSQ